MGCAKIEIASLKAKKNYAGAEGFMLTGIFSRGFIQLCIYSKLRPLDNRKELNSI